MLLLHELHTLAGRHEDAFEDAVRTGWMPALAGGDDARLLYYLKLAHGTGRAYQVVTITALRDGNAYERLATRVQRGDLREWAAASTGCGTKSPGSCSCPSSGHRCRISTLATVPTDGREHEPALYMEDSAWPYEAKLDAYLEAARTHYAPSLEQQTARSLLTLLGVFQAALGAPRRREVVLWQRVDHPERLPGLFTMELPAHVKGPGTWMHDALRSPRRLGEPPPPEARRWSPLG